MKDPTEKEKPEKRNRLDADLDAMLDDAESSLASLNAITDRQGKADKTFSEEDFDLGIETDKLFEDEANLILDDDISLEDKFSRFGEIGDEFDITGLDDDLLLDDEPIEDSLSPQETDLVETVAAPEQPEIGSLGLAEDEFKEFDEFGDDFFDDFSADNADSLEESAQTQELASNVGQISQDKQQAEQDAGLDDAELKALEPILDTAELANDLDEDAFLADFDISAFDDMIISDDTEVPDAIADDDIFSDRLSDALDANQDGMVSNFGEDQQQGIKELLQPIDQNQAMPSQNIAIDYDGIAEQLGVAGLSQFNLDQEVINKQQKKLIQELEVKSKKGVTLAYVALGIGVTALLAGIAIAVIGFGTKSEVLKLNESVATLEKAHVEASNVLENSAAANVTQEQLAALEQQVNAKFENLAQSANAKPEVVEKEALPPMSVHQALDKTDSHIAAKLTATEKKAEVKVKEAAPTIAEEKPKQAAPGVVKTSVIKKAKPEKEAIPPKKVAEAKALPKKIDTSATWAVNLMAIKQQWYAQSKAAEFGRKGVPIEIVPVEVNNQTWYRLRVSGFKDRQEASDYAARVKKALNLSSVWVGK
ncbi:MAG: SPOR domain-containing protein [Methylococcaceae bacterium]|jgi:hypothetical protein